MVNKGYRFLFAILGTAPISIGFLCAGAKDWKDAIFGLLAGVLICGCLMWIFQKWMDKVVQDQMPKKIVPVSVVQRRGGPSVFFLAYILPLVVANDQISDIGMIVVALLLFIVCYFSDVEDNNIVAKLSGYRFYDVTDWYGCTFLVMTKEGITNIKIMKKELKVSDMENQSLLGESLSVIKIDDDFFLYVKGKK